MLLKGKDAERKCMLFEKIVVSLSQITLYFSPILVQEYNVTSQQCQSGTLTVTGNYCRNG